MQQDFFDDEKEKNEKSKARHIYKQDEPWLLENPIENVLLLNQINSFLKVDEHGFSQKLVTEATSFQISNWDVPGLSLTNDSIRLVTVAKHCLQLITSCNKFYRWKFNQSSCQEYAIPIKRDDNLGKSFMNIPGNIFGAFKKLPFGKEDSKDSLLIDKIWSDPEGFHTIISADRALECLYLNLNSEKIIFLTKTKGLKVNSVAWNSNNHSINTTKEFLIGCDDGTIILYRIDCAKKRDDISQVSEGLLQFFLYRKNQKFKNHCFKCS